MQDKKHLQSTSEQHELLSIMADALLVRAVNGLKDKECPIELMKLCYKMLSDAGYSLDPDSSKISSLTGKVKTPRKLSDPKAVDVEEFK